MKTIEYTVSGLTGSESRTKLNNSLDKIEGVQKVAVDIARGKVEIQYNEPADENSIKNCIEKTGYYIS